MKFISMPNDYLLPLEHYSDIHRKFMMTWDEYNDPILAHQSFVNSDEGVECLLDKIINFDYGKCSSSIDRSILLFILHQRVTPKQQ